ncbi:MAG: cytochrome C [Gemmatimonadaceae bacterium]
MTDEDVVAPASAQVQVFLDGSDQPFVEQELPTSVTLDTSTLADGPHRLTVRATDRTGRVSVHEVPFKVRNGPGVTVTGLVPNTVRHGVIEFGVNAFSAEEPFEPQRAETHSSIPVWVWVMTLAIVAWAAWYGASMWRVPSKYATTPTYSTAVATGAPDSSAK